MTERLKYAPLRVDFGGGWLDVPDYALPGAYITNCAITPYVTLASWPYERCGGLGGSAAFALLKGRDALQEELNRAGWQDPAIIMETGLCAWRSGSKPELEAKYNPDFLSGLMALRWTGAPHNTEEIKVKPRDYKLIASAGLAAWGAASTEDVNELGRAIHISHMAQQDEGMERLQYGNALAAKYCGSGWGGYALYLFSDQAKRDRFVAEVKGISIEPYLRSVKSSVLLWQD